MITVENVDGVPFADRLVMNRIQSPQTGTTCREALVDGVCTAGYFPANIVHDTASLIIRNTGTDALNVTDLARHRSVQPGQPAGAARPGAGQRHADRPGAVHRHQRSATNRACGPGR